MLVYLGTWWEEVKDIALHPGNQINTQTQITGQGALSPSSLRTLNLERP